VDLLFVMDPLEAVQPAVDTSWALMRCAGARGHTPWAAHPSTLSLEGGTPWVLAQPVRVPAPDGGPFALTGQAQWREVSFFPIVWLRKDPPFDLAYVEATWILDRVDPGRCRVVNDPTGIRAANEKLYALRFPELCPPTLVTSDRSRLRDFVERHGEVVFKPLDAAGGAGILFASKDMRGLSALIEVATRGGARCEAQAYLPGAEDGDKRVLFLDGQVLGAVLRVHGPGEERNNLHLGGTAVSTTLSPADRRIAEVLGPALQQDGLVLVGIDVIDGMLTEVNVTSPTGLQELERLEGRDVCGAVIDWCERAAGSLSAR
jgi:glutathione synthase